MTPTIAVPTSVRERLRAFGGARLTDAQILSAPLDRVEREDFVAQLRKQDRATPRKDYVDLEDL